MIASVAERVLGKWLVAAAVLAAVVVAAYVALAGSGSGSDGIFVVDDEGDVAEVHVVFSAPEGAHPVLHYAEHLAWLNAFQGGRPADRHSNAWTSHVAVGYWLSGAPDDVSELLRTLSGVFEPLDLAPEFAEQERDIVLREYELQMTNNPNAQAAEEMSAFLYAGNAIAASVIGTSDQISAFSYDAARALHAVTHVPEKARVVVIGDLSERQVRRAMRKAGWPETGGKQAEIAPPPFNLAEPASTTFRHPDPKAAPRLLWRRVVALPEPVPFDLLEAETALLREILDTNLPGGLAGPLRYDAAISRSFDIQVWPVDERHVEISLGAAPDAGVSLAELQTALETTLARIAADEIPESTYARVLDRFDGFWPDWDDDEETARWMADYVLDRVASLRMPLNQRALKRLRDDLSRDAVNMLLRQIAGEGRTASAFIGPEETFE